MHGFEFILARSYFAFAITFHIIFPAINIGLSWLIFIFECLNFSNKNDKYLSLCKFWTKIFAMLFGIGTVSGILMSFMFGLTFSKFIDFAGNIIGPLLTFEVLTAFFLEASFLGVMIFGRDRVSKKVHLFSTFCVAFGTFLSAFWILSANSFMQTPSGYEIKDEILHVVNWFDVIFSPSFGWRFSHMLNGSLITASLFVFGVSLYFIKKNRDVEIMQKAAKISATILMITSLLQVFLGDSHGLNTLKYQPSKIAAMEGHWYNEDGSQPIILFGIPNKESEQNDYEVKIPVLGSLILTHSLDGKIPALKDIPKSDRPPLFMPFFCFRVMVGLGILFIIIGIWGSIASRRGKIGLGHIFQLTLKQKQSKCHKFFAPIHKAMLNISIYSSLLGTLAVICGWYVTEIGRQPWVIYGILRSKDSMTPNLDPYSIIFGICFTGIVYLAISIILVRYVVITIKKGLSDIH